MMPGTGQTITLSDGRNLGYAGFGDAQGQPVLFFHGQPGNRLFRHPDDAIAAALGIRLITIDRPGYGLSDYQPRRRLLDWSRDVTELADALTLDRFAVLGFSAGGPYAAACACQIPQRLTRVGLVDSSPPMVLPEINREAPPALRLNYLLARFAPSLLRLTFRLFWRYARGNPKAFIEMAVKQAPQADRDILLRQEFYAMALTTWQENIRVDCRGYVQDVELLMRDWGFRLRDIRAEVHLWQGEADVNTPPAWGHYMAQEIPACRATFYPDEGHFALLSHWREILEVLTGD